MILTQEHLDQFLQQAHYGARTVADNKSFLRRYVNQAIDYDSVYPELEQKYTNKGTLRNKLIKLSALNDFCKQDCSKFRAMMEELKSKIEPKELREDLKDVDRNALAESVKFDDSKDGEDDGSNDVKDRRDKLILRMMLAYPPLRSDLCSVKHKNFSKEVDNYYKDGVIYFNDLKKQKRKGHTIQLMDVEKSEFDWLSFQTQDDHLFVKDNVVDKSNTFCRRFKRITFKYLGVKMTINELRKLCSTTKAKELIESGAGLKDTMRELVKLARDMNHTPQTAFEHYIDNIPTGARQEEVKEPVEPKAEPVEVASMPGIIFERLEFKDANTGVRYILEGSITMKQVVM